MKLSWHLYLLLPVLCLSPVNIHAQIQDNIHINGYMSMEFEKQLGDDGKGDKNASFDADLIDLVWNINATDRLRIATDMIWEHGAASEDDRGNVAIEYAFAEYTVHDWLRFRAGKMFTYFGIYNEIHTAKPVFLTVKEPHSTNKDQKFGSNIRFYPRWIAGVAVLGNGSVNNTAFNYVLQVANGEQENTNSFEKDDNTEKAVLGRLRLTPLNDVSIGLSFYRDRLSELDPTGTDTGKRTSLFSYGGHVEWKPGNWGFEFEYVAGFVNPSFANKKSRHGLTFMSSYAFLDDYTPYLRYEFLDPDKSAGDDRAHLYIYGINVQLDTGLYLKAEMNSFFSGKNNGHFSGTNYTEFKAALAIGF